jgi:hypothetical protein
MSHDVGGTVAGALVAPWRRVGARGLLGAGLAQALAGLALAPRGVRFDGALDVHRTWRGEAVPWGTALLDQLVAWPLAALAATAVLALLAPRAGHGAPTRPPYGAVAGVIGAARLPLVASAPLVLALPTPERLLAQPAGALAPSAPLLAASLAATVGLAWCVVLLATGVRHLTGARGGALAGRVLAVIAAAEVASKGALLLLGA